MNTKTVSEETEKAMERRSAPKPPSPTLILSPQPVKSLIRSVHESKWVFTDAPESSRNELRTDDSSVIQTRNRV